MVVQTLKAMLTAAMLSVLLAGTAVGAEAPRTPKGANPAWALHCADKASASKKADPKTCSVETKISASRVVDGNQQKIGTILHAIVGYVGETPRTPVLVMRLPLGSSLKQGTVLRVDGNAEIKAPFLFCTKKGCEVHALLTPELVGQMKKEGTLRIAFMPFGLDETIPIDVSLTGFSKLFEGLK